MTEEQVRIAGNGISEKHTVSMKIDEALTEESAEEGAKSTKTHLVSAAEIDLVQFCQVIGVYLEQLDSTDA